MTDRTREGKKAWAILTDALRHSDPVLAPEAARLLGDLGAKEGVGPLLNYVRTDGHFSKTAGFYALQQIGDPDCARDVQPLVEAPGVYDDYYWYFAGYVRASAALAVHVLDPRIETAYFDRELSSPPSRCLNMFCVFYGATLLGLSMDSEVLSRLKAIVKELVFQRNRLRPLELTCIANALGTLATAAAAAELQWLMTYPSRYVRGAAAANLASCRPLADAMPLLGAFFDGELTDFAKVKAAGALAKLGDPRAATWLHRTMRDASDPFDRAAAVSAAAACLPPMEWTEVRLCLYDASSWVRCAALEALERDGRNLAPAITALDDPDPCVRIQAAKTVLILSGRVSK